MLREYFDKYKGQKIGFVGCGVSNMPILQLACSLGLQTVVRDRKALTDIEPALDALGVIKVFGNDYLNDIDEAIVFLSPAVRDDLPQLVEASKRGVKITTEMGEFFDMCPCPIFAVTGSDGKTTTTTLTAKLLESAGINVHLGGNIGKNLFCELDDISKDDVAVVELSSFQLMKMHLSPTNAAVTNISPNHLDWHKGMDEYVSSKKNICKYQTASCRLVLNADDKYASEFAIATKAKVIYTSVTKMLKNGVCYYDGAIYKNGQKIIDGDQIILPGIHNRANYCEAIALTDGYVDDSTVVKLATTFGGVEHRCEFIRQKDGVKFYNSSIDSSPSRTTACLSAFNQKVICICGGYDKKIPFEPLADICLKKAKKVVLVGATKDKIKEAFDKVGFSDYVLTDDFKSAVDAAVSLAKDGDIVVLSPACASFDLFKNFAERGNTFKKLINEL